MSETVSKTSARVVDENIIVCQESCSNDECCQCIKSCSRKKKRCKKLPLYRIEDDNTVFIYPKFRVLWSAFHNTFLEQFTMRPSTNTNPPNYLFPLPTTGTLASTGLDEDTGFLVFQKVNPAEDDRGPIINGGVILFVDNNALDYEIQYTVTTNVASEISFYSISPIVDAMSLNVDRDNNLTRFFIQPGTTTGTTRLYDINEFAVYSPNAVSVQLTVTALLPIPTEELPRLECLKFVEDGKKYSLLTVINDLIPTLPGWYHSIPSKQFNILSYLIEQTFQITAKPIPLTPIPPIIIQQEPTTLVVTSGYMEYYFLDLISSLNGYWSVFPVPVFDTGTTAPAPPRDLRTNQNDTGRFNGFNYPIQPSILTQNFLNIDLLITSQSSRDPIDLGSFYVNVVYRFYKGTWPFHTNYINPVPKFAQAKINNVISGQIVSVPTMILEPSRTIDPSNISIQVTRIRGQTNNTVNISFDLRMATTPL